MARQTQQTRIERTMARRQSGVISKARRCLEPQDRLTNFGRPEQIGQDEQMHARSLLLCGDHPR